MGGSKETAMIYIVSRRNTITAESYIVAAFHTEAAALDYIRQQNDNFAYDYFYQTVEALD